MGRRENDENAGRGIDKDYPTSIRVSNEGTNQEFHSWEKLDGQQIRAFYSHKTGWRKFGSRRHLFNKSDPVFGHIIPLFMETMADDLTEVISKNRWTSAIAYMEYYGDQSLAGRHKEDDPKRLKLFDVAVYKYGLLDPKDFLRHFKYCSIPNYLGVKRWDKAFVESVKNSTLPGISMEGVVGKRLEGNELVVVKCKTNAWLNAVKELYSEEEARKIIES